jgi:hypothetical protein
VLADSLVWHKMPYFGFLYRTTVAGSTHVASLLAIIPLMTNPLTTLLTAGIPPAFNPRKFSRQTREINQDNILLQVPRCVLPDAMVWHKMPYFGFLYRTTVAGSTHVASLLAIIR